MSNSPYRKDPRPIEPKVGWFSKVFRAIKEYHMSGNFAKVIHSFIWGTVITTIVCVSLFYTHSCASQRDKIKAERGCISKAYDLEKYRQSYYELKCDHPEQKVVNKKIGEIDYVVCECQPNTKGDTNVQEKQDEQVP